MLQNPAGYLDRERKKGRLASNLDLHMRRAGITQTTLAERAGITKSTLSAYFTRKSYPSPVTLQALAAALGIAVEDLAPESDREDGPDLVLDGPVPLGAPEYVLSAIPGRPTHASLTVRATLPTDVAARIMVLVARSELQDEARADLLDARAAAC